MKDFLLKLYYATRRLHVWIGLIIVLGTAFRYTPQFFSDYQGLSVIDDDHDIFLIINAVQRVEAGDETVHWWRGNWIGDTPER